ncbi:contact-dependent growth inhibition system immunity protein [Pseudomonas sp. Leaf59]|uniref:contact-dependent growth inhibition system immunity protein n=1 Tax=Pseudomonas sp. Leaf59 TaxID=2876556 RepID=UPI0022AF3192|nr:contact-dependent growth inhibition system immunity protein [Pseudomonas sp. Leaf59]
MNPPLTELQQFFGAYFHQDWMEEHATADEVIDSFLLDSSRDTIMTVRGEILQLAQSFTTDQSFQENLFYKQYCNYYYPNQWTSGLLWLNHVVEKFDHYLLKK